MSRRLALLIANDTYSDPLLGRLHAPLRDAEALRDLLQDSQVGDFSPADILVNESKNETERAIERLFTSAGPGDLVCLYFSGHGVRSRRSRLHLAVSDTELGHLAATSVSATFLKEQMEESDAAAIVLLLDCCYSGAFTDGFKSSQSVDVGQALQAGRGRFVLTASSAIELARDGGAGTQELSAFTRMIVEGIATGAADVNGIGRITPGDLWSYVRREMPKLTGAQTPNQYGHLAAETHLARVKSKPVSGSNPDVTVRLGDLLDGNGSLVAPIGRTVDAGGAARPVRLDLGASHLLVVGRPASGKSTMLRSLVGGLSVAHSPQDVRFVFLESGGNRLGSLRRLPHLAASRVHTEPELVAETLSQLSGVIQARQRLYIDNDIESVDQFRRVRKSLNASHPDYPHPDVFVLIDRWSEFADSVGEFPHRIRPLVSTGLEFGIHFVVSARRWEDVPEELVELLDRHVEFQLSKPDTSRSVGRLPTTASGWALLGGQQFRVALPRLDTTDAAGTDQGDGARQLVERVAKRWRQKPERPWRLPEAVTGPEPNRAAPAAADALKHHIRLEDLLGLRELTPDAIRALRARQRHPLQAPIGVDKEGAQVLADFSSAGNDAGQPHHLIVGTVDSGKSELVRTILTSLVLKHSPDALTLALSSFRGISLFDGFDKLPHTLACADGLRKNLSGAERFVSIVRREILRRRKILRDSGFGHQRSSYEKTRLERGANHLEPLPVMLVVCDEFAEWAAAVPDFRDLLIEVGEEGKALGIHLLLSTFRLKATDVAHLGDTVTERIALRTAERADSQAAIGVPNAAALPEEPGIGLMLSRGRRLQLFRAASTFHQTTGQSGRTGTISLNACRSLRELDIAPNAAGRAGWNPPEPPQRPAQPVTGDPLPKIVGLDKLLRLTPQRRLAIPIGLTEKTLAPFYLDFSVSPHLLVSGTTGSGRSTFLRTLTRAITDRFTPSNAQITIVDYRRSLLGAVGTRHQESYAASDSAGYDATDRLIETLKARLPDEDLPTEQLGSGSWWNGPLQFVIVDDYFRLGHRDNPLARLRAFLEPAQSLGLHVILAGDMLPTSVTPDPVISILHAMSTPELSLLRGWDEASPPPGRAKFTSHRGQPQVLQLAIAAPWPDRSSGSKV